jgi:hypothetical protein
MPTKKHEWTAVCDEKGNQIRDFIHCDLCGATVRMCQVTNVTNGNIIRPRGWGRNKKLSL